MKTGTIHKPKQAISNIRGTPASYDTQTRFEHGAWQTLVVCRCAVCDTEHTQHWNTGGADPLFVEKKFRGLGWHFDAFKPKKCVCPNCVTGKITPEEPMAKGNASDNTEPPVATGYQPPQKAETGIISVLGRQGVQGTPPRALTAHEKTKIRQLLDGHFDEARGRYLDDMDDRKIAEEVDVPPVLVTEIRELAYGPLKDDPEVVAFKAEAEAIRQEFAMFKENTAKALDAMHAHALKIEGRLINIEAKAKKL